MCDATKNQSINLRCGHAFGKTCIRKWMESSNQKKCLLCGNPFTDIEIKKIKDIPLRERAIIILEKANKLFGQTIFKFVHSLAYWTPFALAGGVAAGTFIGNAVANNALAGTAAWFTTVASGAAAGAAGVAGGTVVCSTAVVAGVVAGAVCAAAGVDRNAARTFGAGIGVVCAAIGVTGVIGITDGAGEAAGIVGMPAASLGLLFGAFGVTAGTVALEIHAAGEFGITAMGIGGATCYAVAIGAAIDAVARGSPILMTAGTIRLIEGIVEGVFGAIGANAVYVEQEMDPVVV